MATGKAGTIQLIALAVIAGALLVGTMLVWAVDNFTGRSFDIPSIVSAIDAAALAFLFAHGSFLTAQEATANLLSAYTASVSSLGTSSGVIAAGTNNTNPIATTPAQ